MEIIISLEILQLQVLRNQLERCSEVHRECPLRVRSGDEHHSPARRIHALEKGGLDAVLGLVALEEVSQIVISDLADEAGLHTENSGSCDSVGCGSACYQLHSHRLESLPDLVSGLHIHVLHTAFRKVELFKEFIVRKYRQNVCQGVSNAKY